MENWVRTRIECQAVKVTRYKLGIYPNQSESFSFFHVGFLCQIKVNSKDNKYVLTLKDRGNGDLVTAPIPDKKNKQLERHLCSIIADIMAFYE